MISNTRCVKDDTLNTFPLVPHTLKLVSIGLNNSLATGRRQAIIWLNTGILLMNPLEQNSS